jgi:GntR family transcriptional regulator, transcriptional repressor for pyruvate dehydrogenase complex
MRMATRSSGVGVAAGRGASPREKPQQIADELRRRIISGELDEGDSLGREPDLVARFGVSRPSLREALRILETEGLITVVRGVLGGVVVHRPDQRMTARTAALVLQSRNVSLADVFGARELIEPAAVRLIASARDHRRSAARIRSLIAEQHRAIDDPVAFASANVHFHEELVALAGNQTLTIVAEMLNEVVARAITDVADRVRLEPLSTRRRGVRSLERLAALIEAGDGEAAEEHWSAHMTAVRRLLVGQRGRTLIDLADHL